jgi:hypothetical protein
MRIRTIIAYTGLLALIIGIAPAAVDAQTGDGLWYFAGDRTTGELTVFTYAGDGAVTVQQTVTLDETVSWLDGWRLTRDMALIRGFGADQNQLHLLVVTPDGASPVMLPPEPISFAFGSFAAYRHPYYVIHANLGRYDVDAVLLNVETLTAEILPGKQTYRMPPRIAADGTTLRYFAHNADRDIWTLYERELATGETRTVGSLPGDADAIVAIPDRYGDRWIHRIPEAGAQGGYDALNIDGTVTELLRFPADDPLALDVLGDHIATWGTNCAANCLLELSPLAGGDSRLYPLPSVTLNAVLLLPNGLIVIRDTGDNSAWLLTEDVEPLALGFFNGVIGTFERHIAPNARLLMTSMADAAEGLQRVWDLERRTLLVEESYISLAPFHIRMAETALIMQFQVEGGFDVIAVRYSDASVLRWFHASETTGINYNTLLPDGAAIFRRFGDADGAATVHYDPATGTETVLFDRAAPLNMLPLPRQ